MEMRYSLLLIWIVLLTEETDIFAIFVYPVKSHFVVVDFFLKRFVRKDQTIDQI
jgi:hypothetical protein